MQNEYPVHIDSRGQVLIPSELRKAMGLEARSLMILSREGESLRLVPAEVVPKRRIRRIPREELAQGLMDGAVTEQGLLTAKEAIRDLGLDPDTFRSTFNS